MKRIAILLGIVLGIAVAAVLYPRECLNITRAVFFGWFDFLHRIAPQVQVNWSGVATGLVLLALLVVLLHFFARWCCSAAAGSSSPPRRWRLRWTLSMVLGLLVMFVVGYATIGLARHVGWLCSSRAPVFEVEVIRR